MAHSNFYTCTHASFLRLPFPREGRNKVSGQQKLLDHKGQQDCNELTVPLCTPWPGIPHCWQTPCKELHVINQCQGQLYKQEPSSLYTLKKLHLVWNSCEISIILPGWHAQNLGVFTVEVFLLCFLHCRSVISLDWETLCHINLH